MLPSNNTKMDRKAAISSAKTEDPVLDDTLFAGSADQDGAELSTRTITINPESGRDSTVSFQAIF